MRALVISDLHLELMPDYGERFIDTLASDGVDVAVLAGDIVTAQRGLEPLARLARKLPELVYVAGNHEHWGYDCLDTAGAIRRACEAHRNLHFLDRDVVTIAGQRFVGCSLWYSLEDPESQEAIAYFPDGTEIHNFLPDWPDRENRLCREFLADNVRQGDVVVTHQAPSFRSVSERFAGSFTNRFFVSPMDELIVAARPALWIHGHMHGSFDYVLGETRVVCNPKGYTFEDGTIENADGFEPGKVVEV